MSALSFPSGLQLSKNMILFCSKTLLKPLLHLGFNGLLHRHFFPVRINKKKTKNPPQTNSLTCSPCETQPPLSMSAAKQQNALSSALFLVSLETTPWISVTLFFPVAVNTYISLFPRALERIRSCPHGNVSWWKR